MALYKPEINNDVNLERLDGWLMQIARFAAVQNLKIDSAHIMLYICKCHSVLDSYH